MKAHLSIGRFLILASMLVFVSSCKEEDDELVPRTIPPIVNFDNPSGGIIGSITDLGIVGTDLRLMQTVVSNPGNLYENTGGDFISRVDNILVNFYTSSDGMIPSGTYNFSSSDIKEPFTFDSGVIALPASMLNADIPANDISDGSITVHQDGSNYLFIFSCVLNTGELLSGSSSGLAAYQDAVAK